MARRIAFLALFLAAAAPAGAQNLQAEMRMLRGACGPDVQRLCPNVQPGDGRIKACLKANENQMSVGCAKALMKAKQSKSK
ncbi:MAG: cysteine rich repeat-containing protein [Alphaproteobacteria bacterium]